MPNLFVSLPVFHTKITTYEATLTIYYIVTLP